MVTKGAGKPAVAPVWSNQHRNCRDSGNLRRAEMSGRKQTVAERCWLRNQQPKTWMTRRQKTHAQGLDPGDFAGNPAGSGGRLLLLLLGARPGGHFGTSDPI